MLLYFVCLTRSFFFPAYLCVLFYSFLSTFSFNCFGYNIKQKIVAGKKKQMGERQSDLIGKDTGCSYNYFFGSFFGGWETLKHALLWQIWLYLFVSFKLAAFCSKYSASISRLRTKTLNCKYLWRPFSMSAIHWTVSGMVRSTVRIISFHFSHISLRLSPHTSVSLLRRAAPTDRASSTDSSIYRCTVLECFLVSFPCLFVSFLQQL